MQEEKHSSQLVLTCPAAGESACKGGITRNQHGQLESLPTFHMEFPELQTFSFCAVNCADKVILGPT
ncbi:hypothetical protein Y1Q_0001975 [Alligator mississippiensis]|uniref:Uncharacterized protein n=1 Tax=Alligator mississippiensis TaxID=8496 RepID=A0A151PGW2_ALLMI|nr:hypothetical protein Y1Q_0001975 [Alligator mississippiensis]